jgi:hypothetical protein
MLLLEGKPLRGQVKKATGLFTFAMNNPMTTPITRVIHEITGNLMETA